MTTACNIGFIGLGQMATALASGFLRAGLVSPERLFGFDVSSDAAARFASTTGATLCADAVETVAKADVVFFAVKPQYMGAALEPVRAALAPEKDIDGITEMSLAGVFTGSGIGYCPCTAEACTEILDYYGIDCTGKKAAVIGRSLVIGKPAAMLLLKKNATVTVCHTRTADLAAETTRADIIIVSAGHAKAISAEHLAAGQTVIDVGINTDENGKMCGDVDFAAAESIVGAVTPVPGGVGTVTTAVLIKHVTEAALKSLI